MTARHPAPRTGAPSVQRTPGPLSGDPGPSQPPEFVRRARAATARIVAASEHRAARILEAARRSPPCRACGRPLTQGQAGIHASCSTDPVPQREAWPDKHHTSASKLPKRRPA